MCRTKKQSLGQVENRVYEHRVLRRLTQQQLADAVDVSKQTILAMEKGNYSPSLVLAFKIAQYFEADINDIFSFNKKEV
jgi:putative transcriptional regulator